MKNPWILVGAAIALCTQGFATNYADSCALPPPCYEPKPCISCECYVPLYQPVEGCDTFVSVDALYWFARERNLYYAMEGEMLPVGEFPELAVITPFSNTVYTMLNQKSRFIGTKWSPGVRAEVGWGSDCNDWDLGLDWTYFRNQRTSRSSVPIFSFINPNTNSIVLFPGPEQSALVNPWVNQAAITFFAPTPFSLFFPDVKASWRLSLNDITLSMGRTFWLRHGFALRPYAGVRGAWTKTRFQTKSLFQTSLTVAASDEAGSALTDIDLLTKDRFIDRFWGAGLHLGIKPSWYFCSHWSIFANFDAALIYGKSRSQKKENYQGSLSGFVETFLPIQPAFTSYNTVAFKSAFFSMQPIFDLALGLRFEKSWCCGRYHSEIDLAWEHHLWLENNYRTIDLNPVTSAPTGNPTTPGTSFLAANAGNIGISTTLEYGGPILRVRFDF